MNSNTYIIIDYLTYIIRNRALLNNLNRMSVEPRLVLAAVGLLWYAGLWAIGIVGCSAA
jgi:hypothetical protein